MKAPPKPLLLDVETAAIMLDLGFLELRTRVWRHERLREPARFDATAMGDAHVVGEAVRWMIDASIAQGRVEFKRELAVILACP